jgi:hypothetical protein
MALPSADLVAALSAHARAGDCLLVSPFMILSFAISIYG